LLYTNTIDPPPPLLDIVLKKDGQAVMAKDGKSPRLINKTRRKKAEGEGRVQWSDECEYTFVAEIPKDDQVFGSKQTVLGALGAQIGPKEIVVAMNTEQKDPTARDPVGEVLGAATVDKLVLIARHLKALFTGKSPYVYEVSAPGLRRLLEVQLIYPHTWSVTFKMKPWGKFSAGGIRSYVPGGGLKRKPPKDASEFKEWKEQSEKRGWRLSFEAEGSLEIKDDEDSDEKDEKLPEAEKPKQGWGNYFRDKVEDATGVTKEKEKKAEEERKKQEELTKRTTVDPEKLEKFRKELGIPDDPPPRPKQAPHEQHSEETRKTARSERDDAATELGEAKARERAAAAKREAAEKEFEETRKAYQADIDAHAGRAHERVYREELAKKQAEHDERVRKLDEDHARAKEGVADADRRLVDREVRFGEVDPKESRAVAGKDRDRATAELSVARAGEKTATERREAATKAFEAEKARIEKLRADNAASPGYERLAHEQDVELRQARERHEKELAAIDADRAEAKRRADDAERRIGDADKRIDDADRRLADAKAAADRPPTEEEKAAEERAIEAKREELREQLDDPEVPLRPGKPKEDEKEDEDDGPFTVKLDGEELKLNPLDGIGELLKFVSDIVGLIQTVRDYVPAIGFYFDLELKVMEGSLTVETGWAERHVGYLPEGRKEEVPPWEAVMWAAIKAQMTVAEVSFEIGFGLKWGDAIKAVAFIKATGGFSLNMSLSTKSMRQLSLGPAQVDFEIELGFHAEVGSAVEAKATLKATLTLKVWIEIGGVGAADTLASVHGAASAEPSMKLRTLIEFGGVKADCYCSVRLGGVFGVEKGFKDQEVVAPRTLQECTFPSNKPYTPEDLDYETIKGIVHAAITDKWDVTIDNTEWSPYEIAWYVADKIRKFGDSCLNRVAVERSADKVDTLLSGKTGKHSGKKAVFTTREFLAILDSDEFRQAVGWSWKSVTSRDWDFDNKLKPMALSAIRSGYNLKVKGLSEYDIAWYVTDAITKLHPRVSCDDESFQQCSRDMNSFLETMYGGAYPGKKEFCDILYGWGGQHALLLEIEDKTDVPAGPGIKSIVRSKITRYANVEVKNIWSSWDIAHYIAMKILETPGARLDRKTIEATAIAINQYIEDENRYDGSFDNSGGTTGEDKFMKFVNDELPGLIPIDPAKKYLLDNAKKAS
jgi:hypothetical protein